MKLLVTAIPPFGTSVLFIILWSHYTNLLVNEVLHLTQHCITMNTHMKARMIKIPSTINFLTQSDKAGIQDVNHVSNFLKSI